MREPSLSNHVLWFDKLSIADEDKVGGKNASLGEITSKLQGLNVKSPKGFATPFSSFNGFIQQNNIEQKINAILTKMDVADDRSIASASLEITDLIKQAQLPQGLIEEVKTSLATLQGSSQFLSVAVRSSATQEDSDSASFAGQQKTLLNVSGFENILAAILEIYASLYSERAMNYRIHQGITHDGIAMSVGIQEMVRSESGSAGVMFTLDTESGFDQVVFITSAFGLGETVVQGAVNPDEFYVHKESLKAGRPSILRRNLGAKAIKMIYSKSGDSKTLVETVRVDRAQRLTFSISDEDITELARQAMVIESHYKKAMDIEWAKDGETGEIFIVQARPETIKNISGKSTMERYLLKETGTAICEGRSVGHKIGNGPVKVLDHKSQIVEINEGDVLVAEMTDPDWEPAMRKASAIITNRGGRTCHAAIIAREIGIPAVVGCGNATDELRDGQLVTVSCAEGDTGFIYGGALSFEQKSNNSSMPALPFKLMMNIGNPDRAFDFQSLPNEGVGLARLEFIINRMIGVHPKALLNYESLPPEIRTTVERRFAGYSDPVEFYVEKLVEGISTLAAAFSPKKVIVRLSDFKSNEYANLIGGRLYEPEEENPMLGFRGAARYISKSFRDCFELECRAIKKVRNQMGFTNIELMVPFVRTVGEAKQVVELLAENGLVRGENGLRIIMMCELPANALLADEFLEYFDGFSIGSNDLTQLTLGLDRDSGVIAHLFDESNDAIRQLMHMAISACKRQGKYIGICGQGPSDHPDFAKWLMEEGIDSVSLNPDSVFDTWFYLAENSK